MQIVLILIVIVGLSAIALDRITSEQKRKVSPAEIDDISKMLKIAISEAEETVSKYAPESAECHQLLFQARRCLHYSSSTAHDSRWTIKQKRLEGIKLANQAAQLALDSRKLS
jgi:hypothetical protein